MSRSSSLSKTPKFDQSLLIPVLVFVECRVEEVAFLHPTTKAVGLGLAATLANCRTQRHTKDLNNAVVGLISG
jgi:hypothetical protein